MHTVTAAVGERGKESDGVARGVSARRSCVDGWGWGGGEEEGGELQKRRPLTRKGQRLVPRRGTEGWKRGKAVRIV